MTIPGVDREPSFDELHSAHKKALKYLKKKEKKSTDKSDLHSLSKILGKIIRTLDKIDSKGISLLDIFKCSSYNQQKKFKNFFINLDIWGSSEFYIERRVEDLTESHKKIAAEKVEFATISLMRCLTLMRGEQSPLFEFVREKTAILHDNFRTISQYLKQRATNGGRSRLQDDIHLTKISQTLMKENDLEKITELHEPNTDQTEGDRSETIYLEDRCKAKDNGIIEEIKVEKKKKVYHKFTSPNIENSCKNDPLMKNYESQNLQSILNNFSLSKKIGNLLLIK